MIFDDSDSDVDSVGEPDVAGTAYQEALTSTDGFTRGSGGRIKFNKDTKKRRRENAVEDEDVEMAEVEPARQTVKKKSDLKLGHEFRAKVWIRIHGFLESMLTVVSRARRRPVEISRKMAGLTHMRTFP
jgi:hypothetical protein